MRPLLRLLFNSFTLLAIAFPGCDRGGTDSPNVILIVMDTTRADHFSCYGYSRPTSPRIDAFAKTATLYTRAHASSPWTLPSHAAMFTGKDSFEHGAHRLPGKNMQGFANVNPLPEGHVTLAEALEEAGYTTAAIGANVHYLSKRWQLDQGFQTYDIEKGMSDAVNTRVNSWLSSAAGEPFFLFINYMDAHRPFNTSRHAPFLEEPAEIDGGAMANFLEAWMLNPNGTYPPNLHERVIDQYDTAIAILDREIARLLDTLKERGLYDNTLLILTSDHGEAFGEHDIVFHGRGLHQAEVWIPLIVKSPGQTTGAQEDAIVMSSDIPRLVLSHMPKKIEERYVEHFPNTVGNHPAISQNYFLSALLPESVTSRTVFSKPNEIWTAVIDGLYKYVETTDGDAELFRLDEDPDELTNSLDNERAHADRLAGLLHAFMKTRPHSQEIVDQLPLSEEEIKNLRALGYIR